MQNEPQTGVLYGINRNKIKYTAIRRKKGREKRMDEVKLAEILQAHKSRIGSLEHRMDDVEKLTESVNNLTITTSNLVSEVRHTNSSVSELKEQVQEISREPADRWNQVKAVAVTALITTVVTTVISALFMII